MADHIQLQPDGTGKRLETKELSDGGTLVHREGTFLGDPDTFAAKTKVTNADASSSDYGLVVREAPPASVQSSLTTLSSVAVLGTGTADSTQISVGTTGKLLELVVAGSTPFKASIRVVEEAVVTEKMIRASQMGELHYKPPHRDVLTVAGTATAGLDAFRVVVTNLDADRTSDFYVTFVWAEV